MSGVFFAKILQDPNITCKFVNDNAFSCKILEKFLQKFCKSCIFPQLGCITIYLISTFKCSMIDPFSSKLYGNKCLVTHLSLMRTCCLSCLISTTASANPYSPASYWANFSSASFKSLSLLAESLSAALCFSVASFKSCSAICTFPFSSFIRSRYFAFGPEAQSQWLSGVHRTECRRFQVRFSPLAVTSSYFPAIKIRKRNRLKRFFTFTCQLRDFKFQKF